MALNKAGRNSSQETGLREVATIMSLISRNMLD